MKAQTITQDFTLQKEVPLRQRIKNSYTLLKVRLHNITRRLPAQLTTMRRKSVNDKALIVLGLVGSTALLWYYWLGFLMRVPILPVILSTGLTYLTLRIILDSIKTATTFEERKKAEKKQTKWFE